MAKAVLIMDMPEYCAQCPFMANESGMTYCRMGDDGDCHCSVTGFGKPNWCPLIEMPERKDPIDNSGFYDMATKQGFNECLDALEGKGNE